MADVSGKGGWGRRSGLLLAIVGSAVGLGNVWRFPYLALKHGGGSFLIPYLVALAALGVPLMMLELCVGHSFRASAPMSFKRIGRRWELLGWFMIAVIFAGIMPYYCTVLSWCADYFYYSFGLQWGKNARGFFEQNLLGMTGSPYEFGGLRLSVIAGLAVVWLICWFAASRGIRRWIEAVFKVSVVCLGAVVVSLAVYALFLPGASKGIGVFFTPSVSALSEPAIWSSAFSQALFSLSLGFGVIIAYASYLPPKADLKRRAFAACTADLVFALACGVSVFAVMGDGPHKAVLQGALFSAYPALFSSMPAVVGSVTAPIFFFSLFLTGVSAAVSVFETTVSALIDKFGWKRGRTSAVMAVFGISSGIVFATGAGVYWLDIADFVLNNFCLLAACLLEAVAIGWVYKAEKARRHVRSAGKIVCVMADEPEGKGTIFGRIWKIAVAFLAPVVLFLVIALNTAEQVLHPYSGYKWVFIIPAGCGWILMTFVTALYLTRCKSRIPPAKESI